MKTRLLFFVFFIICLFFSDNLFSQNVYRDIVKLKNGNILKGMVTQPEDSESIGIKTMDGSLFIFHQSEIESIEKEEVILYREKSYGDFSYKRKEPVLAFFCSFLLPGGGQYYNEQYLKGGIMTGIWAGSLAMIIAGSKETEYNDGNFFYTEHHNEGMAAIGSLLYLGVYLWSMIDAPIVSGKINRLTKIKLNKSSTISIAPHYSMEKDPSYFNTKSNPSIGMKLTLSL